MKIRNALGAALMLLPAVAMGQATYPAPEVSGLTVDTQPHAAAILNGLGGASASALAAEAATARAAEAANATAAAAATAASRTLTPTGALVNQFVPDSGTLALYLLTEDGGTALTDFGPAGNNSTIPSSGTVPAWSLDGLVWSAGTPMLNLNANIQGVQTYEVDFNKAVVVGNQATTTPQYNTPFGYSGPGIGLIAQLTTNYSGASGGAQGLGTTWISTHTLDPSNLTAHQPGYRGVIDNGPHQLTLVNNNAGPTLTVYLDGIPISQSANTLSSTLATAASGIIEQLGGSSNGNLAAPYATSGFLGEIIGYKASTTAYNASQVYQDYQAWQSVNHFKGIVAAPQYNLASAPTDEIHGFGESWMWCHACTTPTTQGMVPVAAAALNAAYPNDNFTAVVDGEDSATGGILAAPLVTNGVVSSACASKFEATEGAAGMHIAVFHDNGNTERVATGALYGGAIWPSPVGSGTVAQSNADMQAWAACSKTLQARGWITIMGMAHSSGTSTYGAVTNNTYDQNIKDVHNAIVQKYQSSFSSLWYADDPRVDADGAGITGTTATTCNGGATFQNDKIHPTFPCMFGAEGDELAAVIAYTQNKSNPNLTANPAASFTEPLTDIEGNVPLTGATVAVTLLPCAGLQNGTELAQYTNAGGAGNLDTITAGSDYNGGAQDILSYLGTNSSSVQIAAGVTRKFIVTLDSFGAGTCHVTVQ